jgi:hypothetical protein
MTQLSSTIEQDLQALQEGLMPTQKQWLDTYEDDVLSAELCSIWPLSPKLRLYIGERAERLEQHCSQSKHSCCNRTFSLFYEMYLYLQIHPYLECSIEYTFENSDGSPDLDSIPNPHYLPSLLYDDFLDIFKPEPNTFFPPRSRNKLV